MLTIPELQEARRQFIKPIDCPHCGERLNVHVRIVVATRNCPNCGRRVVAEPKRDDGTPFTREQLDAASAAYLRAKRWASRMILAGFLVFFASIFVLAPCRDAIRAAVGPVMDPYWVFMLLVFGPCLALYVVAIRMESRAARVLKCPHCDAGCFVSGSRPGPNPTQLTGNCASCGRKLVNESLPEEPADPLPTVDEFKAAERRTPFLDWPGLFVFAVLMVVMLVLSGFFAATQPARLWADFEQRHGRVVAALLAFALIGGYAFVQIALAIVVARWLARRHRRRREAEPTLNCPHCREGLSAGRHIVASRRCPSCRRLVLADPEPQPVTSEG